jgi:glycogen operon protein
LVLNAYWEALEFELPTTGAGGQPQWRRWIDTSLESPNDIVSWETATLVPGSKYTVAARSVVLLVASHQDGK